MEKFNGYELFKELIRTIFSHPLLNWLTHLRQDPGDPKITLPPAPWKPRRYD